MSNRKILMYEYRSIIYRLQQGESARIVAKLGLAGRHKIADIKKEAERQGWLIPGAVLPNETELGQLFEHPSYQPEAKSERYKSEIMGWLSEGITGKAIFGHLVTQYHYTGSYVNLQRCIRQWCQADNAQSMTVPLTFAIGEAAQIDFGKGPDLYDVRVDQVVSTWFFVMTLCWSRHQYTELVVQQDVETWLNCHQHAFQWFNGVPRKLIIDNPKCAITKACYYKPAVQRSYEAFAQSYGFIISACPPREPKKKGRVESGVKYIKRNFLPFRTFKDLPDANTQLKGWVTDTAGLRQHGSTFEQPLVQFREREQVTLKRLPVTAPEIALWVCVSLYRDCHVRYQYCRYSAPYGLYKQPLWLKITAGCVVVYHQHMPVAYHARLFKPGSCSTKLEHLPPKAKFYLKRDASWCATESQKVGPHCQHVIESLLTDPVNDFLRQAQSILALHATYDFERLEKACRHAIHLSVISYHAIKTLLQEKQEDNSLLDQSTPPLNPVYQGEAHYQRQLNEETPS